MKVIRFGEQARRLLLALATFNGDNEERLSAAEWEAACAIMGLQVSFRGDLPPAVAEECHKTMAEVARRTGLPLHIVDGGQAPETFH